MAYNSISIGSGLELLFFSIALSVKLNSYKKDKEIAEQQKIALLIENQKLVSEQKEKLEVLVKERTHELELEKEKSDTLLLNILPETIADELKRDGYAHAEFHENVSVLFCDLKDFTKIAESVNPDVLVNELNELFTQFDRELESYGIEKIKTIGDAYMCAAGLFTHQNNSAEFMVRYAFAIREKVSQLNQHQSEKGFPPFRARFGIHTGNVIAGVVGIKKFQYDIWGDTVNLAARMEAHGEVGKINISGQTYELIKDQFVCKHRGKVSAKNKGEIDMYFVEEK
jgi:class 3 adenylate cyclase